MRYSVSLNPEEENEGEDWPGGHCNIPVIKALTWHQQNNKSKTNRGVPNNKLRGINGGNVGNELCYFWCSDAV